MTQRALLALGILVLLGLALRPETHADGSPQAVPHFDKAIAPLLARRCLDCHSGAKPRGGLDLTSHKAALAAGKVLVPGNAAASLLWKHVESGKMPPKKPLSADEKELLRRWIDSGAAWGADPIDLFAFTTDTRAGYDWWSLQPVARPSLPQVKTTTWTRNPIDHFVLAGLEAKQLSPSTQAERAVLIRRLYFDLIGLPPAPAEVAAFVQDDAPDAYEKLVERLLAAPQYGERWARHWLDVARFGESNGFEHDELRPNAWPYRDWVIHALNEDMPFDQFARLQLAGDVLASGDPQGSIATGFLVAGGYDTVGQKQQSLAMKAIVRQDELEDLVSTVGQSFLGLTVHCARCHDHKFDPVRQQEYYQLTAALAGVHHGDLKQKAYTVAAKEPGPTHLLVRGNPGTKGALVQPSGVAALLGVRANFGLAANATDAARRQQLAAWITHPKNPLFARVVVNRLWQHHFGTGLVDTPNDFGFNGGKPSHPELLDWLADELARQKFSLKAMHRLIVTAATYRQSSAFNAQAAKVDAGNRLLWRKNTSRLEAEAVRDTILSAAGQLNPQMGGPGYQDFKVTVRGATYYYALYDPSGFEFQRRTIYRTWARSGRSKLLDTLDCPDPSTAAHKRLVTTTPLQALTLLNSSFVLRMADQFAKRVQNEAGGDVTKQITRAYWLAYGRPATAKEIAVVRPVVETHGLAVLCRALFNSNEFVYVD